MCYPPNEEQNVPGCLAVCCGSGSSPRKYLIDFVKEAIKQYYRLKFDRKKPYIGRNDYTVDENEKLALEHLQN
jgi:hypothetical protein